LSDNEIRDAIISLITAGYETTSGGAGLGGLHAADVARRLGGRRRRSEPRPSVGRPPTANDLSTLTYLNGVVHETLRLYSPGVISARRVMRDLWFDGHRIRAGRLLIFSAYVTHRQPELWPESREFRPQRWDPDAPDYRKPAPHEFIPFSGGLHRCIGAVMATTEMTVMLARLVARTTVCAARPAHPRGQRGSVVPASGISGRNRRLSASAVGPTQRRIRGPIASISPGLPLGGFLAMVSRRMCSTDADSRLAISPSERQVSSSASAGSSRLLLIASMTLGTAGGG